MGDRFGVVRGGSPAGVAASWRGRKRVRSAWGTCRAATKRPRPLDQPWSRPKKSEIGPPPPATHLRILRGSSHVELAIDTDTSVVVGFANAVSDGVLAAYIPLLEVRPEYRGRGIGSELVRRLLGRLDLYMVDLVCDPALQPFYERLGMKPMSAMARRNYDLQSGS